MTDLINVGSDSMSLEGEILDPVHATREVIELAARRFDSRGVKVELDQTGEIGAFSAHRIRLRQIVFNLLIDALTKCSDQSVIGLGLSLEDRNLKIVIAHNAADGASDEGLALSLVRRFTSLHDGAVIVDFDDAGRRQVSCVLPECAPFALKTPLRELPLAAKVGSR